jgi:hypothetical protein
MCFLRSSLFLFSPPTAAGNGFGFISAVAGAFYKRLVSPVAGKGKSVVGCRQILKDKKA